MELAAIENSLKEVKNKSIPINLCSDSQWCINSITGVYKGITKNVETVRRIQKYIKDNSMEISWKHIRGHGKDKDIDPEGADLNEQCDVLAGEGRKTKTNSKKYFKQSTAESENT